MSFNHKTLIVYLDGDYRRFKTVADIYKKFKDGDAHILITSFNDNNQLRGKIDLLNDNYDFIDESHILTEYYSTSTYNNAIEIEEILKKINYGHIIIVTSQYHIYRTRLIFKDRFKNDSRFKFIGVNHHTTMVECISEIIKLGLYFMRNYKFFTKDHLLYSKSKYRTISRLTYQ